MATSSRIQVFDNPIGHTLAHPHRVHNADRAVEYDPGSWGLAVAARLVFALVLVLVLDPVATADGRSGKIASTSRSTT